MEAVFFTCLGAGLTLGAVWDKSRFAGFLAQKPHDYAHGQAGQFDIRTQLNGPMICEGVIYGPLGRVTSRFVADFDCQWQGDTCIMREHFHYDDGSTQQRAWHLQVDPTGRIRATADDVEGTGQGIQQGDSVQLTYRLRLPEASGGHVLNVVDWMYLSPQGTIINRSQFRKFGVQVAELVATMRPRVNEMKDAA